MTLTLAIALNVVAAVVLLGGLVHVMAHPRKLKPHVSEAEAGQLSALPQYEEDEQIAA